MNDDEILESYIEICNLHQQRLELALKHVNPLLPIDPAKLKTITDEDLGFIELMTSRFAKLQDTIGKKIFQLMLKVMREYDPNQSFLDILHKLEKLGIIESIAFWDSFRKVRNEISHEYPDHPELIASSINECAEMCQTMIAFWESLKKYIQTHHLS